MNLTRITSASIVVTMFLLNACGGSDGSGSGGKATPTNTTAPPATPTPTEAIPNTVPDFAAASFTNPTVIGNVFFPLVPETTRAFLTQTEDGTETDIIEVLNDTRMVAGVTSRVVRDRVFEDGLLTEDTHDFFAQDDGGNVWYMGEEVDNYDYDDDGNVIDISHGGAWEAGKDIAGRGVLARPGYAMKATPAVGNLYSQEYYPGVAEDTGEVLALNVPVTLADGSMYSCLQTRDFSPLEPEVNEHKFYAPGVGVVIEETVSGGEEHNELKGTFRTGPDSIPQFASANFSNPTHIDNPFLPLVPGTTLNYEGETEDGTETTTVEVLEDTREIVGVTTVVVRDRVFLDGLIIEDTHDWFAQDNDGNVWYFGEQVDEYEYDDDDQLIEITHDGSWEAGKDVAELGVLAIAGIVMKAQPHAGESYRQEYYPGGAEDMAYIVRTDATLEVDGETLCENCLQTLEWNPLEPAVLEYKFHKSGVGLVVEQKLGSDEMAQLVEGDSLGRHRARFRHP